MLRKGNHILRGGRANCSWSRESSTDRWGQDRNVGFVHTGVAGPAWQSLEEDARDKQGHWEAGWRLMKITFLFQSSVFYEACLKIMNSAQFTLLSLI